MIPLAVLFGSCEEVVNVELNTSAPKLVVEASINWYKGTPGNEQKIKLTTTTDYYSNSIPKVLGATVTVKNSDGVIFNFIETPDSGLYVCTNFTPVLNETYTLEIVTNGITYKATETLKKVAPITQIKQNTLSGFSGDIIEVKSFFNDPADEENYYLYQFNYKSTDKPEFFADSDEFYNGNEFYSIGFNDEIKTGDAIKITHFGISKAYFNYMNILLSIAGNTNGGPFQSPPISAKGNIINTTNQDNYALGYFSLSEADAKDYTVQ